MVETATSQEVAVFFVQSSEGKISQESLSL